MNSPIRFFSDDKEGPGWAGFLDPSVRVEGSIEVPGTLRFDGRLKGRIVSGRVLVLGETADVEGEIEGGQVIVFGRFRGTLRAARIEIHSGAVVSGDLFTPCLALEPGGRFDGQCFLIPPGAQDDPVLVPVRSVAREDSTAG